MALYPRLTGEQDFLPSNHPFFNAQQPEAGAKIMVDSMYAALRLRGANKLTQAQVNTMLKLDTAEQAELSTLYTSVTNGTNPAEVVRSVLVLGETRELPLTGGRTTYEAQVRFLLGV